MWSQVLYDWILATQQAIATLQWWLGLLEGWQQAGGTETEEFHAAYLQLQDSGLIGWATTTSHGIADLAATVVHIDGFEEDDVRAWYQFPIADEVVTRPQNLPPIALWR